MTPMDGAAGFYNCPALWKDLPDLLAEAKAGGASCSLGPQWDASEEWGGLEPLYQYLDVFMPNEVGQRFRILSVQGLNNVCAPVLRTFVKVSVGPLLRSPETSLTPAVEPPLLLERLFHKAPCTHPSPQRTPLFARPSSHVTGPPA